LIRMAMATWSIAITASASAVYSLLPSRERLNIPNLRLWKIDGISDHLGDGLVFPMMSFLDNPFIDHG